MQVRKRSTLVSALKKRSQGSPTREELHAITAEIQGSSDRACALVWGALVEDALRRAITLCLDRLNEAEADDFFGENGPAGTFSNKIKIGYALKIYARQAKDDLNIIREIRNAFAHSQIPLSFKDQEITDICELFGVTLTNSPPQNALAPKSTTFANACSHHMIELLFYTGITALASSPEKPLQL